jgi:hypothetical protein
MRRRNGISIKIRRRPDTLPDTAYHISREGGSVGVEAQRNKQADD